MDGQDPVVWPVGNCYSSNNIQIYVSIFAAACMKLKWCRI